jgi:hypothetical protein
MIEAALDRTLIQTNPQQIDITNRFVRALEHYALEQSFEEFIANFAKQLGVTPVQIEDSFWNLIDSGKLTLSHDFKVLKRD